MTTVRLDLASPEAYAASCLRIADEVLADFSCPEEVAGALGRINAYPGLEALTGPRSVVVLEDLPGLPDLGRRAALEGGVLWELAAAGEATRLGLGRKFHLAPADLIRATNPAGPCVVAGPGVAAGTGVPASGGPASGDPAAAGAPPAPIALGPRRLLQLIFELSSAAEASGLDPAAVMARQRALVICSEEGLREAGSLAARLWSRFAPLENLWLMGQASFHGLVRGPSGWRFDPSSPRRLHNHGQMAMQKTMDRQILRLDDSGRPIRLSRAEVLSVLGDLGDLVSHNVEDLDFLTGALDAAGLGLAVGLGGRGFGMAMEIIPNNPDRPVKGGMCARDPALGRDVVVEGLRLLDLPGAEIKFLNKNFNHYPRPALAARRLAEEGLFMPVGVFGGRVYFLPVQGDVNFLTPTRFFTRRPARPLNSLKTPADIPAALAAMGAQDAQPGFLDFARRAGLL